MEYKFIVQGIKNRRI